MHTFFQLRLRRIRAVMLLPWCACALALGAAGADEEKVSYLDNGQVKLGVNLSLGGAITYLSRSDSTDNLINSHDWGRQVQQSYYSGPHPFGESHPAWKNWPWNPITSGDVYGNRGRTLDHRNDGKTIYVKSTPMQWALKNVPGDCTFETWQTLDRNQVRVRNRLTNARADKTNYRAHDQELPAVYTTGKYHRLITYDGSAPFTGAAVREVWNQGPPWTNWTATEHWAALVNEAGWGLGVIHPGVVRWIGGFAGQRNVPGKSGPKDGPTGYISPIRREILDHNIVYEFEYRLVLGSVEQIRAAAEELRPDPRPEWRWEKDRQHWTSVHLQDQGWPIAGAWKLKLEENDPQLLSPELRFAAADVPRLTLTAAFRTKQPRLQLFWSTTDQPGFRGERTLTLDVVPDGKVRDYPLELGKHPAWKGTITGLRLDPTGTGSPGEAAEFHALTWKPGASAGGMK